ncbi:MAG: ATP synthase subunit I [Thermodesulfobacteriota bacterium]
MIAIIAFFVLYIAGQVAMGKGVLLGTLFSILNFVIMGETLSSRMAPTEGRRLYLALGSIAVRYALLAIPLVLAIRLETFSLAAVVIGLFSVQAVMLADNLRPRLGRRAE